MNEGFVRFKMIIKRLPNATAGLELVILSVGSCTYQLGKVFYINGFITLPFARLC